MFELMIKTDFAAAHFLRNYNGNCARLHGHNWHVKLYIHCYQLNDIGLAMDYAIMKRELKDTLLVWDHYCLNDIPPFDCINPSSENIARELYKTMAKRLNNELVQVSRITIAETCSAQVCYRPDK